jgi:hypothetical protein
MDASRGETKDTRTDAVGTTYEPPALTVIGPMSHFTFGSKANQGDGPGGGKRNP